jgi:uncharacterized membrane protein YphA (DoxX/SURF4 family)/sulfur relay (sulfurtransferase) DsrC/TusE family protein
MSAQSTTATQTTKGGSYYLLQAIRILVGVLFIFSGLIKANDPLGLAYKMQEFFDLWKMSGLAPYALTFSIAMIVFEIIAGVALLLGYAFRLFSVLLLLLMIFFTFLTGYAIWYEAVNQRELKCGCFGDCIPLTAMQSFIKDIVLLVLVVVLVVAQKYIKPLFKRYINTSLMILTLFFSLFIQWWAFEHLPFVDCLPYKVGNNIWEKMQVPPGAKPDVYKTMMVYEEKGKKVEVDQDSYLADSTLWSKKIIESKVTLVEKGNATPAITDFEVLGYDDTDYTESLLKEPGYNFLLFIKDTDEASTQNMDRIKKLIARAFEGDQVGFYILSANSEANTEAFKKKHGLTADTFKIDATVCKTAMRANPGLMLIKGGTVIGKWSFNDYPTDFELKGDKLELKD